jgi:hypothetical protein
MLDILTLSSNVFVGFFCHALNYVSELWISIVAFLSRSGGCIWVHFVFVALQLIDDILMISLDRNSSDAACYCLQLLERLLICPLFTWLTVNLTALLLITFLSLLPLGRIAS